MARPQKNGMRVLFISGSFPPMKCGVGDYTATLVRTIGRRGDTSVAILTSIHGLPISDPSVEIFPIIRNWKLSEIPVASKLIHRLKPDIVHMQFPTLVYGEIQWFLPAIARMINGPVVQTWHEYHPSGSWLNLLNALLPGGLIVVRPNYKESMPAWYRWMIRGKEFRYIPNASSIPPLVLTEDEKLELRSKFHLSSRKMIVYFGFASPAKGIERIFDIADSAYHHIVLVCDLNPAENYHRKILDLAHSNPWSGHVSITGYMAPQDSAALLATADAAIFPFLEGGGEWNSSIHAATAQGTFTLTTSRSRKGYDGSVNIYFAEPGNIEEMRNALNQYLGSRTPPKTTDTDWDLIANEHMALYNKLIYSS